MPFLRDILDAVLPTSCVLCESLADDPHFQNLCRDCASRLPRHPWPLATPVPFVRSAWCLATYEGIGGRLVRIGKYGLQDQLVAELSAHAARFAAQGLPRADVVVPVPSSPRRALSRGFSAPAILADTFASTLGIKSSPYLVRRKGKAQASLSHSDRQRNVDHGFEARVELDSEPVVLLVDDVLTTGATASVCARALLVAGAKAVHVFALASALS